MAVIFVVEVSFVAVAAYERVPAVNDGERVSPLLISSAVRADTDARETFTVIFIEAVAVTESVAVMVTV